MEMWGYRVKTQADGRVVGGLGLESAWQWSRGGAERPFRSASTPHRTEKPGAGVHLTSRVSVTWYDGELAWTAHVT
jgi:hypothetical protein